MKCKYCGDPIYKFQSKVTIPDRENNQEKYHKGCYEIMIDRISDRVKKLTGTWIKATIED